MNIWIQSVLFGVLIGTFLLIAGCLMARPAMGWVFDKVFARIATDPYWRNLLETYHIATDISSKEPLTAKLRSDSKPSQRLFGAEKVRSPWDDLFFNPVYLHRMSLEDLGEVESHVLIGPAAARPLRIEIPILIGGMSYKNALSALAKQALAMGATKAGTAANTGDGVPLTQERAAAERLIVQYGRGSWDKHGDMLKNANAVEIQLGQATWGSVPSIVSPRRLLSQSRLRRVLSLLPGNETLMDSRFKELGNGEELRKLVDELRRESGGVPVGVKIGATQWLEAELREIVKAGVDFISIDGAEGGCRGGSPAQLDGVGIPTLYALVRARRFLDRHDPERKISLLIGGGLTGPGAFLKAVALGADAVFIGTTALLAIVQAQARKVLPWEPPMALVYFGSPRSNRFDPFTGAQTLANFLRNSVREMKQLAFVTGRDRLSRVGPDDLCTTDRSLAEWLRIPWAGNASLED